MCSYDVTSLFTNIPLTETIDIICQTLFPTDSEIFNNFTKSDFNSFLKLVVSDPTSFFLIMRRNGLTITRHPFKPTTYFRYVDDTFTVFQDKSHSNSFLQYLNNKHPNISFTLEPERDHKLSFLDTSISLTNGRFTSEVYRKNTFTGLGTSFFSNSCLQFKTNAIRTLINRAYHLSSTYSLFHSEIQFLTNFFRCNGYPQHLFDNIISRFLNNVQSIKPTISTVPKLQFYFPIPFYNDESSTHIKQLVSSLSTFYPQVHFIPSLSNPKTTGSLFRFKDRLPSELMSGVVYKFSCGGCNASYIGCTRQRFGARVSQHLGRSDRTGTTLSAPPFSEPRNHSASCHRPISPSNFSILDSSPSNLLTLESLYIKQLHPSLNNQSTSSPLHIV